MFFIDCTASIHVGQSAGDFEDTLAGAGREAHFLGHGFEETFEGRWQAADLSHLGVAHLCIGNAGTLKLDISRGDNALAYRGACLGLLASAVEHGPRGAADFNM